MALPSSKVFENIPDKEKRKYNTENQVRYDRKTSLRWFRSAINGIQVNSKLMPDDLYDVKKLKYPPFGELVLYGYDAKTKDKLPYWDSFPLVLMTNIYPDGFAGLNLHYVPLQMRKEIIKILIHHRQRYASGKPYANKVIPVLNEMISTGQINFCYKRYLTSHIMTKFVVVGQPYWGQVAELPLQQFNKSTKGQVWKDFRRP